MTTIQQMHDRAFTLGALHVREAEDGTREFTGIAVPWNKDAHIRDWFGDYFERFEPGAVQDSDDALIFWRHDEPIGKLVRAENTDEGWKITGRLSATPRGEEAYQLLKDGVLTELSIGFFPQEWREADEDGKRVLIRTKVLVREISLVPFGAFGQDATVSQVRERNTHHQEGTPAMGDTLTRADLDSVLEDMERRFALGIAEAIEHREKGNTPAWALDTRSAGEVLKALASGDEVTVADYEAMHRAYTGGTSADAVDKPGWVGNLTRIFDASSGVLANVFSTGPLPDTGTSIEYAELESNTIAVDKQANEGDDIGFGKVKITTKTAPVATYAGGTQLTRQSIERASVSVLNTSLDALAIAAGARKKAALRAAYDTLVAARVALAADAGVVPLGATLAAGTAGHWEDLLIDAAIRYEALNLTLDGLLVSGSVFKKLRSLTVAGERVFQTYKDNASGVLDLPGLTGDFAGLPVRLDTGATGDKANFVNGRALRQYDSALVSLSDENIVNLSKSFAVYRYGAVAAEIPAAVVPVKFG